MRCGRLTCLLLLLFSPAYVDASPADDVHDMFGGELSRSSTEIRSPLIATPSGTSSSALFSPIPASANFTKSIESAGIPDYQTTSAPATSSPIVAPAVVQDAPELPKIELQQYTPGAVTSPTPVPYAYIPDLYADSDSGFTAALNGLNCPFMVGIPLGFSFLTGTRVLPDSFQPQFAARFPSVGQAGTILASGVSLGIGFNPGGLGTFGLNYRILSGLTKVYYVTASGVIDPLVAQYVNPANNTPANIQAGYVAPATVIVSDAVGSCIVASHFTLNQMDLTYRSPMLPIGSIFGLFAEIGSRGAVFYREDYTNASTVFQQTKSTDAGFGPVGGLGFSLLLGKGQVYVKADGGNLFSWAHQLDREMVVVNNAAQIQAAEMNGFHGVPMLGVEAGIMFYEGPYLTLGVRYRFDQWWGLDNLGGSMVSWDSNGVYFDLRWRY